MSEAKWYVVHTYSGYENKVKANIEKSIQNLHLEDQILEELETKDGIVSFVMKPYEIRTLKLM